MDQMRLVPQPFAVSVDKSAAEATRQKNSTVLCGSPTGLMPERGVYGPFTEHSSTHAQVSLFPQASGFSSAGQSPQYSSLYEQNHAQHPQLDKVNGPVFNTVDVGYGGLHTPEGISKGKNFTLDDSPPPPRVYRPCVVCNDKSSGYHYGISSCEGCKGFFRRSVQKNMQYTCHKDKTCPINKVTRNRCQYCRLHKCLSSGMSKDAVRNDRNKKRRQKAESTSGGMFGAGTEELSEEDQALIADVVDAYRATIPLLEDQGNSLPYLKPNSTMSAEHSLFLWEIASSTGIVKVMEFAKRIPGFLSLPTTDRITLLKGACLEIMVLRISHRYNMETDMIQFATGKWLDREAVQNGGFGADLTSAIFNFSRSLKALICDETEFALLSAICLMSGDRSSLKEVATVEKIQEPILEALKHYMRSRRPDNSQDFAKVLVKFTDLRYISVKGDRLGMQSFLELHTPGLSVAENRLKVVNGAEPLNMFWRQCKDFRLVGVNRDSATYVSPSCSKSQLTKSVDLTLSCTVSSGAGYSSESTACTVLSSGKCSYENNFDQNLNSFPVISTVTGSLRVDRQHHQYDRRKKTMLDNKGNDYFTDNSFLGRRSPLCFTTSPYFGSLDQCSRDPISTASNLFELGRQKIDCFEENVLTMNMYSAVDHSHLMHTEPFFSGSQVCMTNSSVPYSLSVDALSHSQPFMARNNTTCDMGIIADLEHSRNFVESVSAEKHGIVLGRTRNRDLGRPGMDVDDYLRQPRAIYPSSASDHHFVYSQAAGAASVEYCCAPILAESCVSYASPVTSTAASFSSECTESVQGISANGLKSVLVFNGQGSPLLSQDDGDVTDFVKGCERDPNCMSIGQLIGGAIKIEPNDWLNF